jgi:hypothetical protein
MKLRRLGTRSPIVVMKRLTQAIVLSLVASCYIACEGDDNPNDPPGAPSLLSETLETADIVFHYRPGDSINAPWQQAFHEWATNLLSVSPSAKIQYYKYRTEAEVLEYSGANYRSWADISAFSIHTVDPQHGHEAIHLYTSLIGWPSDYILEGLAVGLNLDPFTGNGPFYVNITDYNAHSLSRLDLFQGDLILIENILESKNFWNYPERATYPQAGSFVNFLFSEYGIDNLRVLISSIKHNDTKESIMDVFEATYGFQLSQAEHLWHEFLRVWSD